MGAKKSTPKVLTTLSLSIQPVNNRKDLILLLSKLSIGATKQDYLKDARSDIPLIISCIILLWIVVFFCIVRPPYLSEIMISLFNGYMLTQTTKRSKCFIDCLASF